MDKLENLLVQHKNDAFLLIEPEGNYGDTLLSLGLYTKLRELDITYKVLQYKEKWLLNKFLRYLALTA